LGIELPENVGNERYFEVNIWDLIGGRLDVFYNFIFFINHIKALEKSSYNLVRLKNVISFLESGSRPSGGVSDIKEGVLSLGGEHVNTNCEIEIKNAKYVPYDFHKKILNTETKKYDILLVKDGATTGKIGVIEDNEHVGQNINEHVFLIRGNHLINTHYLAYLIYSQIIKIQIKRGITGATVTGLTKDVVNNLYIPLPPIEKQNEIAEHIQSIRARAKMLQEEAREGLERAKIEIEKMIIN